jgi:hypothetical protein
VSDTKPHPALYTFEMFKFDGLEGGVLKFITPKPFIPLINAHMLRIETKRLKLDKLSQTLKGLG